MTGAAGIYLMLHYELPYRLTTRLAGSIHPGIFLLLMAVLPLAGVSIIVFLVLAGMKFGAVGGLLVTAALIPVHLAVAYYLSHSILRQRIIDFLEARNKTMPRLPEKGAKRLAVLFMLFPGLPYAVKNYLLALSDMEFKPYFLISFFTQFILGIPFIILGKAVIEADFAVYLLSTAVLLAGYLLLTRLRQRYQGIT